MTPADRISSRIIEAADRIRAFTDTWPGDASDLIMSLARSDRPDQPRAPLNHSDLLALLDLTEPTPIEPHPNAGIPG